ncbi:MAG: signal recognition particle-docking protein FtsY [Woeseiaceae bacterium]
MFSFKKSKKDKTASDDNPEKEVVAAPLQTDVPTEESPDKSETKKSMFGFLKSNKNKTDNDSNAEESNEASIQAPQIQAPPSNEAAKDNTPEKKGLFSRLSSGLSRTRSGLTEGLASAVLGAKTIDDDLLEEIEDLLITSDLGMEATTRISQSLTKRISRNELKDSDSLFAALREEMQEILSACEQPLVIPKQNTPFVILVLGINGAGKTTTIGKLAKRLQNEGKTVMLAAGDTFRAAAVEQLQVWGERNNIPVIAQQGGTDSASVIYDAIESAASKKIDVLIADTAGRLHTQTNLMEELKKIKRVMGKADAGAPHETMLVLDAGTGQNALNQAEQFHQAMQLTSISLTKLDGTAKGGVIFAIAHKLGLPIRFIGVGEAIEDLRIFNAKDFVNALFDKTE